MRLQYVSRSGLRSSMPRWTCRQCQQRDVNTTAPYSAQSQQDPVIRDVANVSPNQGKRIEAVPKDIQRGYQRVAIRDSRNAMSPDRIYSRPQPRGGYTRMPINENSSEPPSAGRAAPSDLKARLKQMADARRATTAGGERLLSPLRFRRDAPSQSTSSNSKPQDSKPQGMVRQARSPFFQPSADSPARGSRAPMGKKPQKSGRRRQKDAGEGGDMKNLAMDAAKAKIDLAEIEWRQQVADARRLRKIMRQPPDPSLDNAEHYFDQRPRRLHQPLSGDALLDSLKEYTPEVDNLSPQLQSWQTKLIDFARQMNELASDETLDPQANSTAATVPVVMPSMTKLSPFDAGEILKRIKAQRKSIRLSRKKVDNLGLDDADIVQQAEKIAKKASLLVNRYTREAERVPVRIHAEIEQLLGPHATNPRKMAQNITATNGTYTASDQQKFLSVVRDLCGESWPQPAATAA